MERHIPTTVNLQTKEICWARAGAGASALSLYISRMLDPRLGIHLGIWIKAVKIAHKYKKKISGSNIICHDTGGLKGLL